mmetsp:Transcript_31394/g.46298  ORF Transcript_31394/g.46298 Transcript_31394/m.46298 type:complete len:366 (+) Transcript_31394:168-1265(+)|eukprot:CAMPEP_0194220718 /NCGR_PEP_ID=MMETSP0156-20130528/29080_1 /TAXON_ID=33649 /ORGANISM="Thalassionema nitzschioides, Strain L26-B" /LENGTH=365 /DNA_ID=CAMNT_0038950875 /DNA_START=74 /DNA_END=1174 /DNA_ORIENTATION=+
MASIPPSFPLRGPLSSSIPSLDTILKSQFELCRRSKIIRTDPLAPDVLRRKIPGKMGLIAEHEPSLFVKKRPATVPKYVAVDEPFNPHKFNFNKVGEGEVMVTIADGNESVDGDASEQSTKEQMHRILVNVSPLMYGHGLLVPWSEQCLPQQLCPSAVDLAIRLLRRTVKDCNYCIGFNSLGAFSSVNHLHLHVMYPSELDHEARGEPLMEGRKNFPVTFAEPVKTCATRYYKEIECKVEELQWFVPCFAFRSTVGDDECLKKAVSRFVQYLQSQKVPHNVLFVSEGDDKIRVIIIPRQHQDHFDKEKHGFNAALGELSGMLIARTVDHFDLFEEAEIVRKMECYVAINDDTLSDIYSELRGKMS